MDRLLSARWRHRHRRTLRMVGGAGVLAGARRRARHRRARRPCDERLRGLGHRSGRHDQLRRHPAGEQPAGQADRQPAAGQGRPDDVVGDQPERPLPGRADLERLHRVPDHHRPERRARSSSRSAPAPASDKILGDGTVAADGPLWSAGRLDPVAVADRRHPALQGRRGRHGRASRWSSRCPSRCANHGRDGPDLPSGMALSADGSKLYVALNGTNKLGVINTATNKVVKQIPVGNAPRQVVLVGGTAYVSNEGGRPRQPTGEYTNLSDGTPIVANTVTGAATTGTVSVVNLTTGKADPADHGRPRADRGVPDPRRHAVRGQLQQRQRLADQHRDASRRADGQRQPAARHDVGSYPNAITMPDSTTCWSASAGTTRCGLRATTAAQRRR